MYIQDKRSIDVKDIIGNNKERMNGIKVSKVNRKHFAGMKRDSLDQTLTQTGGWIYPHKNTSVAFEHLDMTQTTYNNFLQTTSDMKFSSTQNSPERPVAGVGVVYHPGLIEKSMVIKEIKDKRNPKWLQKPLPEHPTKFAVHRVKPSKEFANL